MTTVTYLGTATPELTDIQIKAIFANLDAEFNTMMLNAFSHASRNNFWDHRRSHILVLTILILYILATVSFYCEWATVVLSFITDDENFWAAYNATPSTPMLLTIGIIAILSMVVADATLVWALKFALGYGNAGLFGYLGNRLSAGHATLLTDPGDLAMLAALQQDMHAQMIPGMIAPGQGRPFGNHSISQNDTEMSVGSGQEETLLAELDLEEGLKDSTEVRGEESVPIVSAYDRYAHVVGTPRSASTDYKRSLKH
ncbi:hypothetical protein IW261DRAFT_1426883 [Armillaria novae-zelandiae]|uniref:Uncharacterized protein n=1 Tax=Armillaria novae-zelandiae TaxID=153914 RepID=A0AA39NJ10_9AGAR|nr:hypothetical protein IW261DRAFT_1426883 [Armillaria novae-zelandiae]